MQDRCRILCSIELIAIMIVTTDGIIRKKQLVTYNSLQINKNKRPVKDPSSTLKRFIRLRLCGVRIQKLVCLPDHWRYSFDIICLLNIYSRPAYIFCAEMKLPLRGITKVLSLKTPLKPRDGARDQDKVNNLLIMAYQLPYK